MSVHITTSHASPKRDIFDLRDQYSDRRNLVIAPDNDDEHLDEDGYWYSAYNTSYYEAMLERLRQLGWL